ncbi:hypothetical protein AX17_003122 [Amanita inopinata Kibby_2008]|nr:hypothetical protein AX17_003122 [Amanita inopinata Kibby_2008]
MLASPSLAVVAALLASFVNGHPPGSSLPDIGNSTNVCQHISRAISSKSDVYYPTSGLAYMKDISHWASSSAQQAACSVEPGTAEDLGRILQILGETKTPFGVKGGGHATNPGFSSSPGILIALYRFNEATYHPDSQTATIGSGLICDDAYGLLEPYNVSVLAGRVSGIGMAGFILGGGYSWKTNQHGLALDSVVAFELVMPNGRVVTVTETSDAELFFGLKGGFNNFGIVTRFTMKAYPQTAVWGGSITYLASSIPDITSAVLKFSSTVTDPKASMITTYGYTDAQALVTQLLFYDGPSPPSGIFDDFMNIPAVMRDVSERSILSLVQSAPSNTSAGQRGAFHTVPVLKYTPNLLQTIINETTYWGQRLSTQSEFLIAYSIEPFLPEILSFNDSPSAYPPDRSQAFLPLNLYLAWSLETFDDEYFDAIRESAAYIRSVAISEGLSTPDAPKYPNYALFDTPLRDMYGDNVARLKDIRSRVDPHDVMGLAGGFKF